jgi:hypothetical protein
MRCCRDNDIKVLDFRDILFFPARQRELSPKEMEDLIREIEQNDNVVIKDKSSITETQRIKI